MALLWQDEQDATCPGCGHPLDESTADENQDAYEANLSVCHGCGARERAAADLRADRTADTAGVRIGTTLNPDLRW